MQGLQIFRFAKAVSSLVSFLFWARFRKAHVPLFGAGYAAALVFLSLLGP